MHWATKYTNMSFTFEILANNIQISLQCLNKSLKKIKKRFFNFKFFDLLWETNLFFILALLCYTVGYGGVWQELYTILVDFNCYTVSKLLIEKEKCPWMGIEYEISGLRDQHLNHWTTGDCMIRQTSDIIWWSSCQVYSLFL